MFEKGGETLGRENEPNSNSLFEDRAEAKLFLVVVGRDKRIKNVTRLINQPLVGYTFFHQDLIKYFG